MNWKKWLQTLASAAATGAVAATGHALTVTDPKPKGIGITAAVGAALGALGWAAATSKAPPPPSVPTL